MSSSRSRSWEDTPEIDWSTPEDKWSDLQHTIDWSTAQEEVDDASGFGPFDYSYSPLSDYTQRFRLLRLFPRSRNAAIQAKLYERHEVNEYEALSYTWGQEDASASIALRARGCLYRFQIRPNLESALKHLRYTNDVRDLWIDAICINQEDDQEKSAQVPMLARIFGQAEQVCIWLGEADHQYRGQGSDWSAGGFRP